MEGCKKKLLQSSNDNSDYLRLALRRGISPWSCSKLLVYIHSRATTRALIDFVSFLSVISHPLWSIFVPQNYPHARDTEQTYCGGNIEIFCPIRQTTDHAKNPATIFWCLKFRILIYLTTPMLLFGCIKKIRRGATFGNFEKLNRQIINSEQLQKMGLIMLQWPQTLGWLDTPCTNWYPISSQTLLSYSCFGLIEKIKKFFATYSLHLPQSF